MVHDRNAPAELVGFLHVVSGEHDRLPVPVELTEKVPQRQAALGVEPSRRLVQEKHRRPVEDGTGNHEALCHPTRQRVDGRLGPFRQLERREQLVAGSARLLRADAEQPAVVVEVLPDSELAVQRVLLGHHAAELLRQGRVRHHVDPADKGASQRSAPPVS